MNRLSTRYITFQNSIPEVYLRFASSQEKYLSKYVVTFVYSNIAIVNHFRKKRIATLCHRAKSNDMYIPVERRFSIYTLLLIRDLSRATVPTTLKPSPPPPSRYFLLLFIYFSQHAIRERRTFSLLAKFGLKNANAK